MSLRRCFTVWWFGLLGLWGFAARADTPTVTGPDLRDVMQARNFGMGGAYQSLGYGAEVIGGNPAGLSLYKRYQIEANGAWDIPSGFVTGGVALADSTGPLAMGISYNFVTFGGFERRWAHLTTLALSYALADWLHLGVSGRHQVITGATNTNSISMSAGLVVKPATWLSLGFSGHNLIPNYNADVTRFFVASVSGLFLGQLTPVFDLRMDFNQPQARLAYQAGLEWLIAMTVPVRVGYQYDGIAHHQYLSGGLGWFVEGSGIDVSYRHELGGNEGRLIALTLKMQL